MIHRRFHEFNNNYRPNGHNKIIGEIINFIHIINFKRVIELKSVKFG